MLFQAHNKTRRELEETRQNEEEAIVEQKHAGTEKLLPLCEVYDSNNPTKWSFLFSVNTTVTQKVPPSSDTDD